MTSSMDEKFQAGTTYGDDEKSNANYFSDPGKVAADILKDYASVRSQTSQAELVGVIKSLLQKGQPLDDKKG
jgi:linoleate 10R-lipoxygenase